MGDLNNIKELCEEDINIFRNILSNLYYYLCYTVIIYLQTKKINLETYHKLVNRLLFIGNFYGIQ